jgi:hypothetical protein
MENFLEKLKEYFENNTNEKILEDWEKSEKYDEIKPTVEDFLKQQPIYTSTDELGCSKIG